VGDGNKSVKSIVTEKADEGFLGIYFSLKKQMDNLINSFPVYINKTDDLLNKVGELEDISEYNKYMRQKIEENVLLEEEILAINQNQPTLE
jgi:hypothetical protein